MSHLLIQRNEFNNSGFIKSLNGTENPGFFGVVSTVTFPDFAASSAGCTYKFANSLPKFCSTWIWVISPLFILVMLSNILYSIVKSSPFTIKNAKYAIHGNLGLGPTFGGGHDLCVCDQSNIRTGSYSNFGFSYNLPDGSIYGGNAKDFLAGNYNQWTITEIEVYQISWTRLI